MTRCKFESLRSADDASFEVMLRIYEHSMPTREQKSLSEIAAAVARPDYRLRVARLRDEIAGFSMLFLPGNHGFGLLEYMAVAAQHRSQGVGGELFRDAMSFASASDANITVLLEVDADRSTPPTDPFVQQRQSFYRRLGCRRVGGLSYHLPLAGQGPTPEMDLFLWHRRLQHLVPKAPLAQWLEVIYTRVYDMPPGDPRVDEMLLPLADPLILD